MKQIFAPVFVCAAFLYATPVFAEEEKANEETTETESAEKTESADAPAAKQAKVADVKFSSHIRFERVDAGAVQVKAALSDDWVAAEEKHYYPFGSTFALQANGDGARAEFSFGEDCRIVLTNAASFATRPVAEGDKTRVVLPRGGVMRFELPRALAAGRFQVVAPHFMLKNLAGESLLTYTTDANGDAATVRVLTGSLAVEGQHYAIAKMGAADQMRIRTEQDDLFTSIRCDSGTYKVQLAQGMVRERKDFLSKETQEVEKMLDFEMSPKCAVKIFRKRSRTAGRMLVDVMTFAANGAMQNHRAFAEKRYNVNSGELVLKPSAEAAAKKAIEEAADAKQDEEKSEEADEKADEEKSESEETSKENKKEEE